MVMESMRTEGWLEVVWYLLMVIAAVILWYMNGMYLNWIVFVVGIGGGVIMYIVIDFAENRPVAGFPITMLMVIVMLAALRIKSLVVGVVAAITITTAIKVYEVYL